MPSLAERIRSLLDQDADGQSSDDLAARLDDLESAISGLVDVVAAQSQSEPTDTPDSSGTDAGDVDKANSTTPDPESATHAVSATSDRGKRGDGSGAGAKSNGAAPPAGQVQQRGSWTAEQINAMSADDINKNMDSIAAQWRAEAR